MNTEIQKQFVSHEIAVRLKFIGFNKPTMAFYNEHGDFKFVPYNESDINLPNSVTKTENENKYSSAPLWQECIDYIRLIHNIDVVFVPPVAWQVQTYDNNMTVYNFTLPEVQTIQEDEIEYHKAKEEAILKAIELIEKQK